MLRILVICVFAISILSVSLAQAATPAAGHGQTNVAFENPYAYACEFRVSGFVAHTDRLCVATHHHKSSSPRCLVDIAPLASISGHFATQRHTKGDAFSLGHPKSWLRKPALAPPRLS